MLASQNKSECLVLLASSAKGRGSQRISRTAFPAEQIATHLTRGESGTRLAAIERKP
jgi:hypothetical protein